MGPEGEGEESREGSILRRGLQSPQNPVSHPNHTNNRGTPQKSDDSSPSQDIPHPATSFKAWGEQKPAEGEPAFSTRMALSFGRLRAQDCVHLVCTRCVCAETGSRSTLRVPLTPTYAPTTQSTPFRRGDEAAAARGRTAAALRLGLYPRTEAAPSLTSSRPVWRLLRPVLPAGLSGCGLAPTLLLW